jgi:ADP-ribose pyrophosphatase
MRKIYKKLSEEVVFQDRRVTLKCDRFLLREGEERTYCYVDGRGGSMVVPILDDGRFVLVKQYRYLRERYGIEFPGGLSDENEAPQSTAIRELLEETGFASDEFINIGCISDSKSFIKPQIHIFVAKDVEKTAEQRLDETEDVEILYRREDEIKEMIARGEIWDSHTLAAWSLFTIMPRDGDLK